MDLTVGKINTERNEVVFLNDIKNTTDDLTHSVTAVSTAICLNKYNYEELDSMINDIKKENELLKKQVIFL